MTVAYMRNRRTTEHRSINLDGEEYQELVREVGPDGRPVWEQTGYHDAAQQKDRIASGTKHDEDYGDDDQPVARIMDTGPGISVDQGLGYVTEGEAEQGLTPEDKAQAVSDHGLDIARHNAGTGAGYEGMTKDALQEEVDRRGLTAEGSGASGGMLKDDLIDALEENDEGSSE